MLQDFRNNIDFFLRNATKFSRKDFVETDEALLLRNKQENLYTTDILNQFFNKTDSQYLNILDIGCKNWFYAKGEWEFFNSFCKDFSLDGVEIDAYRLYSNLYSRYEVAKYYTRNLKNTNYIAGNLLDIKQNYDYIIWILPFVTSTPHQYWGLPMKYFSPKELLNHAYSLLKPDGQMLIINQGQEEANIQQKLLTELNINYTPLGEIVSQHFQYKHKRYGVLIKK